MKTNNKTVCLVAGQADNTTKDICRSLAKEGISAIVKHKEVNIAEPAETPKHWSGQPGQDLFFNGWKLLF